METLYIDVIIIQICQVGTVEILFKTNETFGGKTRQLKNKTATPNSENKMASRRHEAPPTLTCLEISATGKLNNKVGILSLALCILHGGVRARSGVMFAAEQLRTSW